VSIPFSGVYSDSGGGGGTFSGVAVDSATTLGSKIEGWIVRLVAQGKVIRTESNQPALKKG
jgi:hypothetical protein